MLDTKQRNFDLGTCIYFWISKIKCTSVKELNVQSLDHIKLLWRFGPKPLFGIHQCKQQWTKVKLWSWDFCNSGLGFRAYWAEAFIYHLPNDFTQFTDNYLQQKPSPLDLAWNVHSEKELFQRDWCLFLSNLLANSFSLSGLFLNRTKFKSTRKHDRHKIA